MLTPTSSTSTTAAAAGEPWWGRYDMAVGVAGLWRIGPLALWVEHLSFEWRIASTCDGDAMDERLALSLPAEPSQRPDDDALERYCFGNTGEHVELRPALPDRSLVARSGHPINVLAGEEVMLYVSSPVWVRIDAGAKRHMLAELPTFRPSDTWFGSPTGDGELSYASRSFCRLYLDELPQRPHRAVSAVRVRNRARDALRLTALNLPMPRLSLYADATGALWTQSLTLERRESQALASLMLEAGAPAHVQDAHKLTPPRQAPSRNPLVRAFSTLFHT